MKRAFITSCCQLISRAAIGMMVTGGWASFVRAQAPAPPSATPIQIEGPELRLLDISKPDGGLPPAMGVQNYEVFRACRLKPELAIGRGYTFNHDVDLACWHGKLYVAWSSAEKDEDSWPARELYSTSTDGGNWTAPLEFFPQGISTPLRMHFFQAQNGRMLGIAGLRLNREPTTDTRQIGIVVREIRDNHLLGTVYTLKAAAANHDGAPAMFDTSEDQPLIQACRQLLACKPFLAQQDEMSLTATGAKPNFVEAPSFFNRNDGALVGIGKRGLAIISSDLGETWSAPMIPPTLITGTGKVWGERAANGFALVYNPQQKNGYPLVMVCGNDGIHFKDMRVIHGELPIQRYGGLNKSIGAQDPRGISSWAGAGTWSDDAMWIAYSENKEDIWVSRIPLPLIDPTAGAISDDFSEMDAGPRVPRWNTYSPKWSPVSLASVSGSRFLQLKDSDPHDHPRAVRLFSSRSSVFGTFSLQPAQDHRGLLEIELMPTLGSARPIQIHLTPQGTISARNGVRTIEIGKYAAGHVIEMSIVADCNRQKFSVTIDHGSALEDADFAEPAREFGRISFKSFSRTDINEKEPLAPESDLPAEQVIYGIGQFRTGQ